MVFNYNKNYIIYKHIHIHQPTHTCTYVYIYISTRGVRPINPLDYQMHCLLMDFERGNALITI